MTFSGTYTATDALTVILVLVTMFYAWATFHILKANRNVVALMKEQVDSISRPYVVVSVFVRTGTPLICLRVQNSGKTPANQLKLSMDRDFFQLGRQTDENNLAKHTAFSKVIDSFSPGATLEFALAMGPTLFAPTADESVCPKVFWVTAAYTYGNTTVSEKSGIDLRPFIGTDLPRNAIYDGLSDITKAIRELATEKSNPL